MRCVLSAVALVVLLAGQAPAQTYTLKIKSSPDKGESIVVQHLDKSTTEVKVTTEDGKVLDESKNEQSREEAYTETVLEKGKKHPTKYKRAYTKAREKEGKKELKRSYAGRTVVFTGKNGKFTVAVEGKPDLAKKDLKELTSEANKPRDDDVENLLPSKPVKVGETWKISGKALARTFPDVAAGKSKGMGKLVKVYRKGKQQWGVLEFTLTFAYKEQEKVTFEGPGRFTMTLETAIDGSTALGKMKVQGQFKAKQIDEKDGKKFLIHFTNRMSHTTEHLPKE
jgi:hypothetical protein